MKQETQPIKSNATVEGMQLLEGDLTATSGKLLAEDLVYFSDGTRNLRIRMMIPTSPAKSFFPLVCHVVGSAWMKQNLNNHVLDFKEVVQAGYGVAFIEYTPVPDAQFPQQVLDVKKAITYLNHHAHDLGIDTANMFLSGDSSGGHTALLSWVTWDNGQLSNAKDSLPAIQGCIDLYGVTDLTTIADYPSRVNHEMANSPESLLLGAIPKYHFDLAKQASIPYYLEEKIYAPLLILHGNCDSLVPFEQAVILYNTCQKTKSETTFFAVNNADHGGPSFYTTEVLATIVNFLNEHTN